MAYTKTHRVFEGRVSGVKRPTGFSPWTAYNIAGPETVETLISESHSRLNGRWSGGGPFRVSRSRTSFTPAPFQRTTSLVNGTVVLGTPTTGLSNLTLPGVPSDLSLSADAATAFARTEPLNPAFDLPTLIGELRMEGIPNLPGRAVQEQVSLARKSGSEYLNVEFGWLPLVRGLRDFAKVVNSSDQILTEHRRKANVWIDRSYEWPETTNYQWSSCNFVVNPDVGFFTGGGRFQHTFTRKWYEAEYKYYLPTGPSMGDKFARYGSYARKLLGVAPTPEAIWNLSPWSWAADWFSNAGDVIHNVSALGNGGLVFRNAYIMSHTGRVTIDSGSFAGTFMTKTLTEETKIRRAGTPFGFDVSFSSLSPRQLAITAALGLSRW
nr:MAG: hypothetical protein 1 [Leviviridae sp.]